MRVKLPRRSGAIFDRMMRALFMLACVVLVLALLSVSYEIVMRYFFSRPQIWVVECASYGLVFIAFLSTVWVLKNERHVRMSWLLDQLNPRNQSLLNIITSILGAIVWLVIAWYAGQATWGMYLEGVKIDTTLEPFKAPLFVIIPIGSFLLSIQLLRQAYGYLRNWRALPEEKRRLEKNTEF